MPKFIKRLQEKGKNDDYIRNLRNQQRQKYYSKTAKYEKHDFTPAEDQMILAHEITDPELSEKIHHSVQSIQIRRSRLKNSLKRRNQNGARKYGENRFN